MKSRSISCASALAALALVFIPAAPLAAEGSPALPTISNPKMSLRDALQMAARNNVTLKQMQADANSADAAARSVQAQIRPGFSTTTYATIGDSASILTSSPSVTPQNLFNVPSQGFTDQDLMLMVPLFTGGRLKNASAGAWKQGEAATLSVEASRLTVAASVTEGYALAALQQALVDTAQARLTAEDEQVRVTQEKVNTGRLAPVDLLREQAEQADARQGLLAAQNNAALALIALKTALGVSQESQIALTDTFDRLTGTTAMPATLRDALRQADLYRPELAAAQRRVEAAQSGIRAARGEYAPQVYGVAMGDAMAMKGGDRLGYTLGVTASLPLYDGGQRRADVDGAQARLDRAQADAQQMRQQVDQETAAGWLNLQTAITQVEAAAAGVTAAQQAYDLANLRYNAGKSVTAERLDALTALTRAEGSRAAAKASMVIARARLIAAIGGVNQTLTSP